LNLCNVAISSNFMKKVIFMRQDNMHHVASVSLRLCDNAGGQFASLIESV
jgi:hypothetical protein